MTLQAVLLLRNKFVELVKREPDRKTRAKINTTIQKGVYVYELKDFLYWVYG